MSELTPDEVRASIVPKSDQLNADDLLTGPMTVTIIGVKQGDKDQPITVELEGQRPYKPCKTCRRILIAVYGDRPANWIGHRLTLWCDPSVMWAGVRIGGIRISHMTGIDRETSFMLTVTRGKKTEVLISPIEDTDSVAKYRTMMAEAETQEALKAVGFLLKEEPESVRVALRSHYEARQNALKLDIEDLARTLP